MRRKRKVGLRYGWPKAARKWLYPQAAVECARQQALLYCNLELDTTRSPIIWRERQFQASLVSYIDKKYPAIGSLCFHVPLELLRRDDKSAGMFGALGARAGVADVVMLVPRGAYHGFVLELKIAPRRPTDAQCRFLLAAREARYAACWTDSYTTALALVDAYLALPERAQLAELHTTLEELPDEFRRKRKAQAHRDGQAAAVSTLNERAVAHGAAGGGQSR